MKKLKFIIGFFLFCFFLHYSFIFGQIDTTSRQFPEFIEDLLEQSTIDIEESDLYDLIEELLLNPININYASINEFLTIPFIDVNTAELIIDNRNRFGQYFSVDELYSIKGIDSDIINKTKFFLTTKKTAAKIDEVSPLTALLNNTLIDFRSRIIIDVQDRKGFIQDSYEGTKIKNYNRLKIRSADILQLSFLSDKDPGETSYTDFLSGHAAIKNIGIVNMAVLGDYLVEFGQGLALWSPYAFSKGSEAVRTVNRRSRMIVPYSSSFEASFFRGAGVQIGNDKWKLTAFYSSRMLDSSIDSTNNSVSTIQLSGFHRTESELNKNENLRETTFGGIMHYSPSAKTSLSFLHYRMKYSNPFISDEPFDFQGTEINFTSVSYSAWIQNILFSGEFAYNGTSVASINSMQFNLSKNAAFITSFRNYPRNYFNILSNGFGERSGTKNETGFYSGIRLRTGIGIFNIYYDIFKFPFATFSSPVSTNGNEIFIEYRSRPMKKVELNLRYKVENKEVAEVIDVEDAIVDQIRKQIRAELIINSFKFFRLKSRIEYSDYSLTGLENEDGILIYQDIRFTPSQELQIAARFTFFDTQSFNTRIYAFENDLRGILTNSALFGEGVRWYALVRYSPFEYLDLTAKYAETYKPDEKYLSSGLNEIEGNLDNRISFQLDINL